MQAVSKRQARAARRAYAAAKGFIPTDQLSGSARRMLDSMNEGQLAQMARTGEMGLPDSKGRPKRRGRFIR